MADIAQFEEEFAIFDTQSWIRKAYWKRQQALASVKEQQIIEFNSTAKRGWSRKFRQRRYEEVVQVKHRELEVEFVQESFAITNSMRSHLLEQVQIHRGVDQMRKHIIRPYSFNRFRELPKELQILIWTQATYLERKRYNYVLESSTVNLPSSIAECRSAHGYVAFLPLLLRVCQDSRALAQRIFPRATFRSIDSNWDIRKGYTHPLQDEFYLFGHFYHHRILKNLLIPESSRHHLNESSISEILCFSKIQFLTIQLHTFTDSPRALWGRFNNLKVLTVAFYPYISQLRDNHHITLINSWIRSTNFTTLKPRSVFGERGEWLCMILSETLQRTQKTHPHLRRWQIPKIEALLLVDLGYFPVNLDNFTSGHNVPSEEKDTAIGSVWDQRQPEENSIEYLHRNDLVFNADHAWYRSVLGALAESRMHRMDSDGVCVEAEINDRLPNRCEQCEGKKVLRSYTRDS